MTTAIADALYDHTLALISAHGLSDLLDRLGAYIGAQAGSGQQYIVPKLSAAALKLNDGEAFVLLDLLAQGGVLRRVYNVYCRQKNALLTTVDNLEALDEVAHCDFCDAEHDSAELKVEVAFTVADEEFNRINNELPKNPDIQLLRALERHYYRLTTRSWDAELSLTVISVLRPLYSAEVSAIIDHLDTFVEQQRSVLEAVYGAEEEPAVSRSAFLYQPEALMIYDRLKQDELGTRTAWGNSLPESELELIANRFGISFD